MNVLHFTAGYVPGIPTEAIAWHTLVYGAREIGRAHV